MRNSSSITDTERRDTGLSDEGSGSPRELDRRVGTTGALGWLAQCGGTSAVIPIETIEALRAVIARADAAIPSDERKALTARAIRLLPDVEAGVDLESPTRSLVSIGADIESRFGAAGRAAFAAALVADLALRRALLLTASGLPESVLALYPATYRRLAGYLSTADLSAYWFGNDSFQKDLCIASGFSVPCGPVDVDLVAAISRGSALKAMALRGALSNGWAALRSGGPPWYRLHVDSRSLDDFNEAGWDRCYLRIAEMLIRDPRVKGVVGTTWFFDPQIVTISPRLAYLQTRPLRHGAFLLPHGPSAMDTENATSKSETRRRLYQEGRYLPMCYSMIWPRSPLIAWAQSEGGGDR